MRAPCELNKTKGGREGGLTLHQQLYLLTYQLASDRQTAMSGKGSGGRLECAPTINVYNYVHWHTPQL